MQSEERLTGRERNQRIKAICKDELDSTPYVELGKGTARGWAHIRTWEPVSAQQRESITKRLLAARLIHTYWPDDGIGDERACVSFGLVSGGQS